MAKGENIFKRKDGRWEARYIKGYQSDGKIRYGFCYGKTYREAKEKVTKAKAAMLSGNVPAPAGSKQRFVFYCVEWMKASKSRVKPATRVKYECIMEKYIKPRLGRCFPQGFNDQIIGEFTNELLFMEELAPKTVRDILTLLKSVLKYTAKQLGGVFPQIDIVLPKDTRKEMRVLSREEQAVFTAYLLNNMDEQKFGVLLALLTGVRIGELCALRWENISLKDGTIRITSTMQRLQDIDANGEAKTKIVFGTPKSDTSVRTIPMCDYAISLCQRMKPRCGSAFVLSGTSDYMEPRLLQYRLERYTKDCQLEGVHFHTLRHTFATRCVEIGFDVKSLSEILGHANTAITLDRYVHASLELKRAQMNRLAAEVV